MYRFIVYVYCCLYTTCIMYSLTRGKKCVKMFPVINSKEKGMKDIVKIRTYISTSKVGSECIEDIEMERELWDCLPDEEKEDICRDVAFNSLNWGWEELE